MFRFYFNSEKWNPTREQWLFATRCITITELERIHKFVYKRDAKFALIGQLLIRYLLSKVFQRSSASFSIQRTEYRRPFIDSDPSFDFNLSHHYHLVCIVGTFHGRIGCDTMEYQMNSKPRDTIENQTNLLRNEFTVDERRFILQRTSDEKQRIRHFYRLWSLKESYVKWLGLGIGYQLSRMNFIIQTDQLNSNEVLSNTILEIDHQSVSNQLRFDEQLIDLDNNEQQIVTVCLEKINECQPFIELNIKELLNECTPLDGNAIEVNSWWELFQKQK